MSVANKLLQAAAGGASDPVYVEDVFSCFLYEGNATSRSIVNGIDLADKGGLVWTKNRDDTYDHNFVDSARGLTNSPYIRSNTNGSQGTDGNGITVFNNNGYTVGRSGSWNANGNSHVSWTFAKQEKFFDIVTYTGDGTTGRQIAHNLGSSPGMMLFKKTNGTGDWKVFHRSLSGGGLNGRLRLDNNGAEVSLTNNFFVSSTHFGSDYYNASGDEWVVYLFAHNEAEFGENSDEAIIYCDSFTTTSTWGNFKAEIGFEPQWLLVKRTDSADNWIMLDMMRGVAGPGDQALVDTGMFGQASNDQELQANSNSAESTQGRGGFYSKGYLGNLGGYGNATYIYVAIRRPNKPASEFAATDLFVVDEADNSDSQEPKWRTTFPVDFAIDNWATQNGSDKHVSSRLMQGKYLRANGSNAESTESSYQFDYMNGFYADSGATSGMYAWMFRRAKGFFDVVTYAGNGTLGRTVPHNLGVTPELMIIKLRNATKDWYVYSSSEGAGKRLTLNDNSTPSNTGAFNSTAPTAASFTVGDGQESNGSGYNYIAYLFATVSGISKVGTYTGTGSNVDVDCGFSSGARFVLVKRTDSTGDWYVYDSVRGIVAGNDPYTLLNTTAVQVTNTDYIDPLNAGFTVTSSAPAGLNASGGTYLFLAIA